MTYLNELDPFAAEWLRNQFPEVHIDQRSIAAVRPTDLAGSRRVHLFAGVGGWELALNLAGWPADWQIWTGSCPCQPFSAAGRRKGTEDARHLWPEMFRLIRECRPATIAGEQVASRDALKWLDGVFTDLEGIGYSCGAADLPAACVGAPHIRQRLFWLADAGRSGDERDLRSSDTYGAAEQAEREAQQRQRSGANAGGSSGSGGLGDAHSQGHAIGDSGERVETRWTGPAAIQASAWPEFRVIPCGDDKSRRIESATEPLAHGIPRAAGPILTRLVELGHDPKAARRIIREARRNRIGRLRCYGNAIVPQVAAAFIRALMESED